MCGGRTFGTSCRRSGSIFYKLLPPLQMINEVTPIKDARGPCRQLEPQLGLQVESMVEISNVSG